MFFCETLQDTHTSHAPISIVPMLHTITKPTQNNVPTTNNNSHKNTTLIDANDNNRMGTTLAAHTTRNNNKFANLIEADYDNDKTEQQPSNGTEAKT